MSTEYAWCRSNLNGTKRAAAPPALGGWDWSAMTSRHELLPSDSFYVLFLRRVVKIEIKFQSFRVFCMITFTFENKTFLYYFSTVHMYRHVSWFPKTKMYLGVKTILIKFTCNDKKMFLYWPPVHLICEKYKNLIKIFFTLKSFSIELEPKMRRLIYGRTYRLKDLRTECVIVQELRCLKTPKENMYWVAWDLCLLSISNIYDLYKF